MRVVQYWDRVQPPGTVTCIGGPRSLWLGLISLVLLLAGLGLDLAVSMYCWFPEWPAACVARLVAMDWELGPGLWRTKGDGVQVGSNGLI